MKGIVSRAEVAQLWRTYDAGSSALSQLQRTLDAWNGTNRDTVMPGSRAYVSCGAEMWALYVEHGADRWRVPLMDAQTEQQAREAADVILVAAGYRLVAQ